MAMLLWVIVVQRVQKVFGQFVKHLQNSTLYLLGISIWIEVEVFKTFYAYHLLVNVYGIYLYNFISSVI